MSQVFDAYARYYDLLYRDKDYASESEYVAAHIRKLAPQAKRILELGCGTGAHAEHLARLGYFVHGVDMSEAMLARAETRKASLSSTVADRLSFSLGDVRTIRTGHTYDAVISLFHVMSYQTSNADLEAAFDTASVHLQPGGLFLFDFWYGPAVLMQRPEVRVKRLADEDIKVTRIAEPEMHVNENVVDVSYTVFIETKTTGLIEQLHETHRMRYFFLPELERYHGVIWKVSVSEDWMGNRSLSEQSWAGIQALVRA
jgi:SAM-dependent methyltransferase